MRYDIAEKIVKAGNSQVFDYWNKFGQVTQEEFMEAVKWLCDDPMPNGQITREVELEGVGYMDYDRVIRFPSGKPRLVKLDRERVIGKEFALDQVIYTRHDEKGKFKRRVFPQISLNCRDRI